MTRSTIDFDTVRKLALDLPGVEESKTYGTPSLKVRGKLMTCMAIHKSAEPGSLVVCVDFDRRADLIAEAPDTYYFTDHYVDYPTVLVRLSRIRLDALKDLLRMAWQFASTKKPSGKRGGRSVARRAKS